jgi:hypothetical protein
MSEHDFDKFLLEATAEDTNQQINETIHAAIVAKLREADFSHVYDPDFDTNVQNAERYIVERTQYYLLHRDEISDDELPEDEDEVLILAYNRAKWDVHTQNLLEQNTVSQITLLKKMQMQGQSIEDITKEKKSYIAGQLVHGTALEDNMLQFFIREAPGDTIDVASEEDRQYFVDSLLETPELVARSEHFMEATQKVSEIIYVNADMTEDDAYAVATDMTIVGMRAQLFARKGDQRAAAQRESRIMEISRDNGILIDVAESVTVATLVLEELDASYPLDRS